MRRKTDAGRFAFPPARAVCGILLLFWTCVGQAQSATEPSVEPERAPNLQSIESAIQRARSAKTPVPVVVRGIVILNHGGLVIEDRTAATIVELSTAEPTALGDEVEVTGQMTAMQRPRIEKGELRRLWNGSMPLPLAITPDQAAEGENELFLVQTEAKLLDAVPAGLTGVRLHLSGGHQTFSAILPGDSAAGDLSPRLMQPGSTLRLTGVLFVSSDLAGSYEDSFTIELRAPDDIELVEGPSWWTGAHILLLMGIAAIAFLICVQIYSRITHARYRAVTEERASISRDIHDTLAQAFAGITLQLEAAERTIEREPARARAYLHEALHLVRHSRNESHLSIEMLRSTSRSDRLDALIARCILQMKGASGPVIEQQVSGEPVQLSYQMVNQLFRIVQEAIANAVRHAHATRISVRIFYEQRQLRLEVQDDGAGFNPSRVPGPAEGNFGLTGMRERAAAIGSQLDLQSGAEGTLIRVMVTL